MSLLDVTSYSWKRTKIEEIRSLRKRLRRLWLPCYVILTAVWIAVVVCQIRYVPFLGHETPTCIRPEKKIKKVGCLMVTGTWFGGIVYR
jgi:hypothetical protein